MAGHGEAGEAARRQIGIEMLGRFGHRAGGFAGGQDDKASARRRRRQVLRQAAARVRGRNRAAKQRFQELTRCTICNQ